MSQKSMIKIEVKDSVVFLSVEYESCKDELGCLKVVRMYKLLYDMNKLIHDKIYIFE